MFIGAYHLLDIVPKGRKHARVRCRLGRPGTRHGLAPHYRDNLYAALALHLFHARRPPLGFYGEVSWIVLYGELFESPI